MSIAMSLFSLLGTFIIGFSMLPQTIRTFKTRDTASLSLLLYLMMGIATAFLTIYGIGLVIIPDPKSLTGDAQNELIHAIGSGTFGLDNDINAVWYNWLFSYIIPGAALIFGEAICSTTSFIVAILKIANMYHARKNNLTEAEYVNQKLLKISKDKKQSK